MCYQRGPRDTRRQHFFAFKRHPQRNVRRPLQEGVLCHTLFHIYLDFGRIIFPLSLFGGLIYQKTCCIMSNVKICTILDFVYPLPHNANYVVFIISISRDPIFQFYADALYLSSQYKSVWCWWNCVPKYPQVLRYPYLRCKRFGQTASLSCEETPWLF